MSLTPPNMLAANNGNGNNIVYRTSCDIAGSYATLQDLDTIVLAVNSARDYSTASQIIWLKIASRMVDAIVGQRFQTPLKSWTELWLWLVCELAYTGLSNKRGFEPDAQSESLIQTRQNEAKMMLMSCRDHEITLDQRLVLTEDFPIADPVSDRIRGWGDLRPSQLYGSGCDADWLTRK